MANKATISLREAATRAGVSRQTIYRWASTGKLSTVKRRDGSKGVDIAELERAFESISHGATASGTVTGPVTLQVKYARLEAELEGTRAQLTKSEAQITKVEADNAWLKDLLLDNMKRLEHQPEPREPGIVTKLFKKLF